jgi:hypothetical protein
MEEEREDFELSGSDQVLTYLLALDWTVNLPEMASTRENYVCGNYYFSGLLGASGEA